MPTRYSLFTTHYSYRCEPVVDEQLGAVDEARFVAGQEQRGFGDFLGLADAALLGGDGRLGDVDTELLQLGDFAQPMRRADEAGANCIAADVPVAELDGNGAGEHVAGAL